MRTLVRDPKAPRRAVLPDCETSSGIGFGRGRRWYRPERAAGQPIVYQSGGLGVVGSNPAAPTNKNNQLADIF
jgi:hypothetical protein